MSAVSDQAHSEALSAFAHRQATRPAICASASLEVAYRAAHALANTNDAAEAALKGRELVRAYDAAAAHIHTLRDLYPEAHRSAASDGQ